ncbi:MAG TPA: alpha/beta hydrolase [Candidatus Acidoferrales bacterium]|nr:alpha/beta hydrolase [Candidatus Acidoferrales bacterium]
MHGTVAARPLVTLHPFLGLANVFPSLTRNRQLIAVEAQGHGRTADIDRPFTSEQEAEDVVALLKQLQIDRADFFGESYSGITAVLIALRYPELVRRVVTYGSPFGTLEESYHRESLEQLMTLTPDHRSVQYQRECYQRVAADPTQWATLFAKSTRRQWRGFSREELKSIKAPVLIATGDHDVLGARLEHLLETYRLIPNAQFAVVPGAGHFVLNDDPEKLLPIIATFLDESDSRIPFATTLSGYHPGETR